MNEKRFNFLPGPVDVPEKVKEAFTQTPISHRSPEFLDKLREVKEKLGSMTGASGAEILMGSGTLANDAAAAQLSMLGGTGLIVTNGEFGERLLDHAERLGLDFETVNYGWGEPFDYEAT
ncbi:MAG: aminotransferase, partial [Proteobacteria bacterium]|nr:aminotransferase [Pseudomonadota bacterium]